MAKSQAAKELQAKQKAELKAMKERKKHSDNPADWSQWRQIRETFRATAELDPAIKPLMAAAILGPIAITMLIGILLVTVWNQHWMWLVVLIMLGVLLAVWLGGQLLVRKAKAASFKRYDGQAGSAEVALQMLDAKKWTSSPAITYNRQMDIVHRTLGPGGLILIGEGESGRVRTMLQQEAKRHKQALYGIEPQIIVVGKGEGQIKLEDLPKHITKLPKSLAPEQIAEAIKRLRALDALRPKMPVPKGPMPTRMGSRSAMRGR